MTDLDTLKKNFSCNLSFFKDYLPDIHNQIIESKATPSVIIDPINGNLHLNYKNQTLYVEGAEDYAEIEYQKFLNIFNKLDYKADLSSLSNADFIKRKPFKRILKRYKETTESKRTKPHQIDVAVFGIGLGFHIDKLSNNKTIKHITIIEKDISVFIASLHTIDWRSILQGLEKGQHITFIIKNENEDYENFNLRIKLHSANLFPSIISTTLTYNHEPFKLMYNDTKKIVSEFSSHLRIMFENIQYDGLRLFNANENIMKRERLVDLDKSTLNTEKIIAIIGAGPSLEDYIHLIKKNRNKFFIITSGTGLSSILSHDITPDAHLELEFRNASEKILKYLQKTYNIKDIPLISTYEVHPSIIPFFKDHYMYCPRTSELIKSIPKKSILVQGGVTCTNSATAFINAITKEDIYLFGCDFAYTNGNHHSKENIHNQNFKSVTLNKIKERNSSPLATISIESVHNEEILTVPHLLSAKLAMEDLTAFHPNKIKNCSNGAKIKNTEHINVERLEDILASIDKCYLSFDIKENDVFFKDISSITKYILNHSINESYLYLDAIKLAKDKDDLLSIMHSTLNKFKKINQKNIGQYRSIMSLIKFPTLILYNVTIFTCNSDFDESKQIWIKDFSSYLTYIKRYFNDRFDRNDFYIEESWID